MSLDWVVSDEVMMFTKRMKEMVGTRLCPLIQLKILLVNHH